ncbi:hypothetical protein, variant [Fonticula alba]|nr:hypothetical protein, variant [Fonticula alba]KCV70692.1 hypothetical protein, variant [Fonticula alba]|eukprot:XP_009495208.1 hypothetical protein, variant [Fonticula alba]
MAITPPKWVQFFKASNDIMDVIDVHLNDLESRMMNAAITTFQDSSDRARSVEDLGQKISSAIRDAHKVVKMLNVAERDETPEVTLSRTNAQKSVALRLQEQSTKLRRLQSDFLSILNGSTHSNNVLLEFDQDVEDYVDPGFTLEQIAAVDNHAAFVTDRVRKINELNQSIASLAEIFNDLQNLVHIQGTVLDRIDYNLENVVAHTKRANEEVQQASKYQKGSQKKLAIILLIAVAIALLLFVAARPRGK